MRRIAEIGWRSSALALCVLVAACGGTPEGPPVRVTIPPASTLGAVTDSLASKGIIESPRTFKLYARTKDADRAIKPGVYEMQRGASYASIVEKLVTGDVVKMRIVVPEGWTLQQIAGRIATATSLNPDSVLARLTAPSSADRYDVPGPTLEGYLYPATYVLPLGSSVDRIVQTMVGRYKKAWTPEMHARARALGMSEREVVALASIVEKEAKVWTERETISAVYHNRLKIGMRLQADPTVQYALGEHQKRLLYAHIANVADNPYNTYRHKGLPPGPIASPSVGAIQAALNPAPVDYLYFVARPGGTHVFTRSLAEHNRAKNASRREAAGAAR